MEWTYEVAVTSATETSDALERWFRAGPLVALAGLDGFRHVDLYVPAEGESADPYNHDKAGPALLLQIVFATREALIDAVRSFRIAAAFGSLPDGATATGTAFERRLYPVADGMEPARLEAPFSYVVRYQRPAEDEAAFIQNYIATHPVTQAKLPGIRAIACYLPLGEAEPGGPFDDPDYMIGNEVAFDDMAAFNVAMKSPVREELRDHYRYFPAFSGANTHYPMTRQRLFG